MNKTILTREDLKAFIAEDYRVQNINYPFFARYTWGENWALFSYMRNLRYIEYHLNKYKSSGTMLIMKLYHLTCYGFRYFRHRWKSKTLNIFISPNTVGPGFHMTHRGYRYILDSVKIGSNCEILPMVLFGKRHPVPGPCRIVVGDNCYISTGVTILGPVTIGDNVAIGAGAVVLNDLPDNCVAAGVPAKVVGENRIVGRIKNRIE